MVIVIHEFDYSDKENNVIGVASDRVNALKIIDEYYGKDAVQSNFRDVRDSNIDFDVIVEVNGYKFRVTGEDFEIDRV